MLDDKHTLSATSISLLILQELKFIRQDMKDELTKLRQANCNKCKNNEKGGSLLRDGFELVSANEENMKGISLLENSPLNIEEPSSEISNEQPVLTEAQTSELSELQIGCVYGNFSTAMDDINNDISTMSSNTKCISNANTDINMEQDTVVALPVVTTQEKQSSEKLNTDISDVKTVVVTNKTAKANSPKVSFKSQHYVSNPSSVPDQQLQVFSGKQKLNLSASASSSSPNDKYTKRRYTCKHCGKDFKSRYMMRRHIVMGHSFKPKHVCTYCKKVFVSNSDMIIHVRRMHTGVKPFACSVCDVNFSCVGHLNYHMKTTHKNIFVNDNNYMNNVIS
ncbi:uncharacterized protein LOC144745993 [Ciona intestinalis]